MSSKVNVIMFAGAGLLVAALLLFRSSSGEDLTTKYQTAMATTYELPKLPYAYNVSIPALFCEGGPCISSPDEIPLLPMQIAFDLGGFDAINVLHRNR